ALQAERRRREQTDRIAARLADHSSGPTLTAALTASGRLPRPGSSVVANNNEAGDDDVARA
ncbi:hypothetical protein BN1723_020709, partial [Verticillium longisporum]